MKKILLLLFAILTTMTGCSKASDISIIGGADGPTSVFIATTVGKPSIICAVLAVISFIALIIIIFYFIKKRK